jgi:4-amino-4-deoxy-L-arabinose transferase-like glycosyltransferase
VAPIEPPGARPASRSLAWLAAGSNRAFVAIALAVGLLIRWAVVLVAARTGRYEIAGDEIDVAQRMVAGLGFTFDYYRLLPGVVSRAFFPPAYVFNVFLLLKTFGSVLAVAWENLVLSLGVSLLVFVFARRLFGTVTGRIALVLSLLYPSFIVRIPHGVVVFPKMILMVALVMLLHQVWVRGHLAHALGAGLAAGLLALMMPDILLYVLICAVALIVFPGRGRSRLRPAIALVVATGLVIAPWTARNWNLFHRLCLVSTNGGFNFYMGNHPGAKDEVDMSAILDLNARLGGALARVGEVERERILYREGTRWICENPGEAAAHFVRRIALHWWFRPSNLQDMGLVRGVSRTRDWVYASYVWSYAVSYFVVALLAVLGLSRCRRRWGELTPVGMAFLYSTLVATLFIVQTKMRLAKVDPFLLIFAAAFIAERLGFAIDPAAGGTREPGLDRREPA